MESQSSSDLKPQTIGEAIGRIIEQFFRDRIKDKKNINITKPEVPKNLEYGELSTDIAFKFCHLLNTSPQKLAEELSRELKDFGAKAINGFVNFEIPYSKSIEFLRSAKLNKLSGKRILCEFVSANPTGPLHVGHGRIAAVGDTIARTLSFCGAEVIKEFYINDAGEQIEKLGAAVLGRSEEYKGKYIDEVRKKLLPKLEDGVEPGTFQEPEDIGLAASRLILEDIKRTLEMFDLKFDSWISEREIAAKYFEKAKELMKDYLYYQDQAWFLRTTAFGDDKDRVVIKSDKKPTYFGNDCAYHLFKVERDFDELVQVWGADHHGYIKRIEAALKIFGFTKRFVVKLVQMVNLIRQGKPVQMSKREGVFVTLDELINEVGKDAAKFIYLTRTSDSHLDFDIDVAKKKSLENPVYYVQYAHARISSVLREAEARGLCDGYEDWKKDEATMRFSEKERKLLALSAVLYDVILLSAEMYEPSMITSFLISLAKEFHSYYQSERILVEQSDVRFSRLFTCETVQKTIRTGLTLLGVSSPDKM